jgi:OHCU decarboxylase
MTDLWSLQPRTASPCEVSGAEYRKAKFGFPFIMAVRGSNKTDILAGFAERLKNSPDQEFECALGESQNRGLSVARADPRLMRSVDRGRIGNVMGKRRRATRCDLRKEAQCARTPPQGGCRWPE